MAHESCKLGAGLFLMLSVATTAPAQTISDFEPNNSKGTATLATLTTATSLVSGTSNSADPDYFALGFTNPDPNAIYRYELTVTGGAAANVATLRGVVNTGTCPAPTNTDAELQNTTASGGVLAWYSAGATGNVFVRFLGTNASNSAYSASVVRTEVEPTPLGNFPSQNLTFSFPGVGATVEGGIHDDAGNLLGCGSPVWSYAPTRGCYRVSASWNNLAQGTCSPTSGDMTDSPNVFAATNPAPLNATIEVIHAGGTTRPADFSGTATYTIVWNEVRVGQEITVDLARPGGPGTSVVLTNEGPANTAYFNFATLNAGAFPNDWFFGLAMPFNELITQISLGAPFVGSTGPTGVNAVDVGVLPAGLTIYFTTRRADLQPHDATPLEFNG